jgi:hypothetical protein
MEWCVGNAGWQSPNLAEETSLHSFTSLRANGKGLKAKDSKVIYFQVKKGKKKSLPYAVTRKQ